MASTIRLTVSNTDSLVERFRAQILTIHEADTVVIGYLPSERVGMFWLDPLVEHRYLGALREWAAMRPRVRNLTIYNIGLDMKTCAAIGGGIPDVESLAVGPMAVGNEVYLIAEMRHLEHFTIEYPFFGNSLGSVGLAKLLDNNPNLMTIDGPVDQNAVYTLQQKIWQHGRIYKIGKTYSATLQENRVRYAVDYTASFEWKRYKVAILDDSGLLGNPRMPPVGLDLLEAQDIPEDDFEIRLAAGARRTTTHPENLGSTEIDMYVARKTIPRAALGKMMTRVFQSRRPTPQNPESPSIASGVLFYVDYRSVAIPPVDVCAAVVVVIDLSAKRSVTITKDLCNRYVRNSGGNPGILLFGCRPGVSVPQDILDARRKQYLYCMPRFEDGMPGQMVSIDGVRKVQKSIAFILDTRWRRGSAPSTNYPIRWGMVALALQQEDRDGIALVSPGHWSEMLRDSRIRADEVPEMLDAISGAFPFRAIEADGAVMLIRGGGMVYDYFARGSIGAMRALHTFGLLKDRDTHKNYTSGLVTSEMAAAIFIGALGAEGRPGATYALPQPSTIAKLLVRAGIIRATTEDDIFAIH